MRNSIIFILFILAPIFLFGQKDNSIVGKLTTPKDKAIPFANVALYKSGSTDIYQGTITDDLGKFIFQNLDEGQYALQVFFIGFKPFIKDSIVVHAGENNLGALQMHREATQLEEVTVVSEKPDYESQPGKMVYNVDAAGGGAGESALEVFRNIPSLGVDMDENVTMRGSKATILIDGVESDLASMLDQLPADVISSVEVINNPSAKYDSKSGGGIINIKLKSDKLSGYNGKLNVGYGLPSRHTVSGNLGFTSGKWQFNANGSIKENPNDDNRTSLRTIHTNNGDKHLFQDQKNRRDQKSTFVRGSARYRFSKKSYINFQTLYQKRQSPYTSEYSSTSYISNEETDSTLTGKSINTRIGDSDNEMLEFTSRYKKEFKGKGHELSLLAKYSTSAPFSEYNRLSHSFDIKTMEPRTSYINDNKVTDDLNRFGLLKADYELPVSKKWKLELGGQLGIRHFEQEKVSTKTTYKENTDEMIAVADEKTVGGEFEYDEIKPGLYGVINGMIGKYNLSAGIRFEGTYRDQYVLTTDSSINTSLNTISPTLLLEKRVNKKYTWSFSYSMREKAPSYRQLNPISSSYSSYYKSKGNPFLESQKTHNFDFSHNLVRSKYNLTGALFLKQVNNIIGTHYSITEEDGKTVTESTFDNLGDMSTWGADLSVSIPLEKFIFRPAISSYYKMLHGAKFSPTLDKEEYSFVAKLATDYRMTKAVTLQINGRYNSPDISPQGKRYEFYTVDFGIKAKVMDKKGLVSLKVVDAFDTREYDKIINQRADQLNESFTDPFGRFVFVAFSYKFSTIKRGKA